MEKVSLMRALEISEDPAHEPVSVTRIRDEIFYITLAATRNKREHKWWGRKSQYVKSFLRQVMHRFLSTGVVIVQDLVKGCQLVSPLSNRNVKRTSSVRRKIVNVL
jgi:hypothetical protein